MKYLIALTLISLCACATNPPQSCPSLQDEPVSMCRADLYCYELNNNYFGQRLEPGYSMCMNRHLSSQKANVRSGVNL